MLVTVISQEREFLNNETVLKMYGILTKLLQEILNGDPHYYK